MKLVCLFISVILLLSCESNRTAGKAKDRVLSIDIETQADINFDTLSTMLTFWDLNTCYESQHDLHFDSSGALSFVLPNYPFPISAILHIKGAYWAPLYLSEGLHVSINLDSLKGRPEADFMAPGIGFSGPDSGLNFEMVNYLSHEDVTRFKLGAYRNNMRKVPRDSSMAYVLRNLDSASLLLNEHFDLEFEADDVHKSYVETYHLSGLYAAAFTAAWRMNKPLPDSIVKRIFEFSPSYYGTAVDNVYRTYCYMHSSLTWPVQSAHLAKALVEQDEGLGSIEMDFLNAFEQTQSGALSEETDLRRKFYDVKRLWFEETIVYEAALLKQSIASLSPEKQDWILYTNAPRNKSERLYYFEHLQDDFGTPFFQKFASKTIMQLRNEVSELKSQFVKSNQDNNRNRLGVVVGKYPFGAELFKSKATDLDALFRDVNDHCPSKLVIIDVWGTWCQPCKADMKNSLNKKEKLKALGVEVVYISTEGYGAEQKWIDVIGELQGTGTHLLLSSEMSKKLVDELAINSYPTTMLLFPNGELDRDFDQHVSYIDIEEFRLKYLTEPAVE